MLSLLAGGLGGIGRVVGIDNESCATIKFNAPTNATNPAASAFTHDVVSRGSGGVGGLGGVPFGGSGANVVDDRATVAAGAGGAADGGVGGVGGPGLDAHGGGLFNAGTAIFTGVTVNFTGNQANGGSGGLGDNGGDGFGGNGGTRVHGGGIAIFGAATIANITTIPNWLSDGLCLLATGGGPSRATRRLPTTRRASSTPSAR